MQVRSHRSTDNNGGSGLRYKKNTEIGYQQKNLYG